MCSPENGSSYSPQQFGCCRLHSSILSSQIFWLDFSEPLIRKQWCPRDLVSPPLGSISRCDMTCSNIFGPLSFMWAGSLLVRSPLSRRYRVLFFSHVGDGATHFLIFFFFFKNIFIKFRKNIFYSSIIDLPNNSLSFYFYSFSTHSTILSTHKFSLIFFIDNF